MVETMVETMGLETHDPLLANTTGLDDGEQ
jgi:hypothetical protein